MVQLNGRAGGWLIVPAMSSTGFTFTLHRWQENMPWARVKDHREFQGWAAYKDITKVGSLVCNDIFAPVDGNVLLVQRNHYEVVGLSSNELQGANQHCQQRRHGCLWRASTKQGAKPRLSILDSISGISARKLRGFSIWASSGQRLVPNQLGGHDIFDPRHNIPTRIARKHSKRELVVRPPTARNTYDVVWCSIHLHD